MVSKKHLKWALVPTPALLAISALLIGLYILMPFILSALLDVPGGADICSAPPPYAGGGSLAASLYDLCSSARALLAVPAMLFIVLAGTAALIPMALTVWDVATSDSDAVKKALWILLAMIFGYLGALAYYLIEARKRS
jgi:predicted outer membrane lipoprotein